MMTSGSAATVAPRSSRANASGLAEQVDAAGHLDELAASSSRRHQRLDPLDAGDARALGLGERARGDIAHGSLQARNDGFAALLDRERSGDAADIVPNVGEGIRTERNDLRRH